MRKTNYIFILFLIFLPSLLFAQDRGDCSYIKGVTKVTGVIQPTCYGDCDGTVTAKSEVIGGVGVTIKYYFDGDTTAKAPFFPGICAGWHKIVSENRQDGCKDTVLVFIPQPDSVSLGVKIDTVSCKTGSFTAFASGGTGALDIFWNTTPIFTHSPKLSNITTGESWTVTARDSKQCSRSITVTMPKPNPLKMTVGLQDAKCKGTASGNIYLYPDGNPPYNFTWADKNGKLATTDDKLLNLVAGDYSVTVTDNATCEYIKTFTVKDAPPIILDVKVSTASCETTKDGAIDVVSSGGLAPYSYSWSSGQTTANIKDLSGGDYKLIVTDANFCRVDTTIKVRLLYPYTTTKNVVNTRCVDTKDGEATITPIGGTSPFKFVWSDGQKDSKAINLAPGTYNVTATDAYGCIHLDTVVINKPDSIGLKIQATSTKCHDSKDGAVTATVTGGNGNFLVKWCDGFFGLTRDNLAGGSCAVTVTDDKGCIVTKSVNIPAPLPLTIDNIIITDLKCFGNSNGAIEVTVSGGTPNYSYKWNDSNSQILAKATNLTKGNYSVDVKDANGCSLVKDITLDEPNKLSFSTKVKSPKCFGDPDGSFEILPEGGTKNYTINWSNGVISKATSVELSATSGLYNVTVTDANNCVIKDTFRITDPLPVLVELEQTKKGCAGMKQNEVAVKTISGGVPNFKYQWSNGISNFTTTTLDNLSVGKISLTITDANQCNAIDDITVEELDSIKMDLAFVKPTCYQAIDGQIGVTLVKGGSGNGIPANYDYLWDSVPLQTSPNANGLQGNKIYTVIVTDAIGCKGVASQFLPEPNPITLKTTVENVKCNGGQDGSAEVVATGDIPKFSYQWNDSKSQVTAKAVNLAFGSYQIIVTDDNNCTASAIVEVEQPNEIIFTKNIINDLRCFGDSNGKISVEIAGGVSPYQYLWNTNETTSKIEQLKAATYSLTVNDANNCTVTKSFNIKEPKQIELGLDVTDVSCFGLKNGSVTITAKGGSKPYYYSTDGGKYNGYAKIIGLAAGAYEIYIKDVNGCTNSETITVAQPDKFEVNALDDITVTFGNEAKLKATYKNNVGPVKLEWSSASNDIIDCLTCEEITVKTKTTATLTLKGVDMNGCKAEDFATVFLVREKSVFVPTGFSPNNDNENDLLTIHGKSNVKIKSFKVFDRWGEILYEAKDFYVNDKNIGWDGTHRGVNMPSGIYVWTVEAEYPTGENGLEKGNTSLIR